jgi:hypothetical protein
MPENPEIIELRQKLSEAPADSTAIAKKKHVEDAIAEILDAVERDVCQLGNWEARCIGAAITALDSRNYDGARTMARKALWPVDNRRDSAMGKYRPRADMLTLAGLRRAFASARAIPPR